MANAPTVLLNLAREVRNALSTNVDDDDSADFLVQSTNRLFRRRQSEDVRRRGRGRPKNRIWKTQFYLLHKPVSSLNEASRMAVFGAPDFGNIEIDRNWTLRQLETYVMECYPNHPLRLVGFDYAKCVKGRKRLLEILHPSSIQELAKTVRAGKVYIVPKRELPVPGQEEQSGESRNGADSSYIQQPPAPDSEDDSFIETDTPTITFRRRAAATRATARIRDSAAILLADSESSNDTLPDPTESESNETQQQPHIQLSTETPTAAIPEDQPMPTAEDQPMPTAEDQLMTPVEYQPMSSADDLPMPSSDGEAMPSEIVQAGLHELNQLLGTERPIKVNREYIVRDMLEIYKDPSILQDKLIVTFENESGQDAGGLTRDLFSSFWQAAFKEFFTGENVFVPSLPVHRFSEVESIYPVLGRILSHGAAVTGTIPIRLCRSALYSIIHEQPNTFDDILMDDLMMFLTDNERKLTKSALNNFDRLNRRQINVLNDMFNRFGFHVLPNKQTLEQNIKNLASVEIGAKPLFLCTQMKKGIPEFHMELFWRKVAMTDLFTFYEQLRPSPERVVDLLTTEVEDLRPNEECVMYFLKDFIYSIAMEDLALFLEFVTGSDVLPKEPILVTFNNKSGLSRHPYAHTCGNVLGLSTCYNSIQEFKREFLQILYNPDSFRMTML